MLISVTLLLVFTSTAYVQGDTYPSWPSDFQWVTDMMVYTTLKGIGYRCAHFHEPNDETYWMDNYLCWKGDPYLKAKITFRSSGAQSNKRCVLLSEPADPNGWDNNHLCVPLNSPYHFTWSYQGPIDGLDCLRIKDNSDPHGWNDNYLCGSQDSLAIMTTSLAGLNEEGMDNLGSMWESAEQGCINDGHCNDQLSSYELNMQQVALGFVAGKDITAGITAVMDSGKFSQFAGKLSKFAPFLGAFGSMVSIVNLFGDSAAEQQLENVIQVLNAGFNRMEYRFDRIEDMLDDLERTIMEEHFWTRLTPRLEELNNVKQRVENYFAVSDPAVRAVRKQDLDIDQYNKVFDAIHAIADTFDGANSALDLCETVSEYSSIDRRVVLNVAMDLYSRMIRGAADLVLISKVLGRADQSTTESDMATLLERIGGDIGTCDSNIESTAWLGQWIDDAYDVLGDTAKNKENELADNFYNTLSAKYYWRDWLVVVYPEMKGSDNHWRHHCYDDVTTLDLKHWNGR